eukprot:13703875-Alexandrium_andersonii.AAC.1
MLDECVAAQPMVPLLRRAEAVGDGVAPAAAAEDRGLGVRHDLSILHVEPLDLRQVARVRSVLGDELRHDGDRFRGVHW